MKNLIFLGAIVSLSACATMGGLRSKPLTDGVAKEFEGTHEEVLQAARESIAPSGLNIEEAFLDSSGAWIIMTKKERTSETAGELVRIVVEPEREEGPVVVRVLTQRRISFEFWAKGDYSDSIFSAITLALSN